MSALAAFVVLAAVTLPVLVHAALDVADAIREHGAQS